MVNQAGPASYAASTQHGLFTVPQERDAAERVGMHS